MKVDVERFGSNNLPQDFKFMKNVAKMVFVEITGEKKV